MSKRLFTLSVSILIHLFLSVSASAQLSTAFNATPLAGCAPLVVSFHDQSTGNPTQWRWDLGNSTISYLQNPVATYFNAGTYTIKLVIQNAAGRDSLTKVQYITVYALPTVDFSASAVTGCYPLAVQFTNASVAGSGSISSYLWDFGDGTSSSVANPAHTYAASGNFNVSLRIVNSQGCTKTITKTNYISIANGVHANFNNSAAAGCSAPETIPFQNLSTGTGVISYTWLFGDGGSSAQTNPIHIYNSVGNYTVQLIAVNSTGCRDTAVHVNAVNVGAVHANFDLPVPACKGSVLTFNNTSLPAPDSVKWSFGDGSFSALSSPVKIYAAGGVYQVKLVGYFGPCRDTVTKTVTVSNNPTSAFIADPVSSCAAPLTVNFTNTSTGAVSYQWIFGDGNTSSSASPSHTYTTAGYYDVSLISTNANGCSDTLTRQAFVKIRLPQADISQLPREGCAPFAWTFSSTINTVVPVIGYQWDFGDGSTSTLMNPTHLFSAGVYDIQLIVTTVGGCTDTVKRIAAIRATTKPTANFTATPRNVCAFTPVQFTDLSTGAITQWHWNFGDGGTSIEPNPSHSYEDTGSFRVMLIVGNYGCFDTIFFNNYIHVNPPIAKFTTGFNCSDPLVRIFTDQSIGAEQWTWDFGDGTSSTLPSPLHTYTNPGFFNVKLTVKNLTTGCEHTDSAQVIVADEHAAFSATQTEICRGTSIGLNAVLNHPGGINSYSWDFGDGTTATGNPVTHIYPLSGIYNVSLIIIDAAGCSDTTIKTNYIKVNGPTVDFNAAVPGSCLLTAINFNDLTVTDGTHAITQWTWNYGDGNTQVLSAPPFSHNYSAQGSYTVSLLVTDAAGCSDSITKNNLLIISTPVAAFTVTDTVSCPAAIISFNNASTGPGLLYQWKFGDGGTSTSLSPVHSYLADGSFDVSLKVTDIYGCTDEITKTQYIRIGSPVAGFAMSDSVSTCPPLVVNFTNTSVNQSTYNWDFGDGNFSSTASPSHFYNVAGIYYPKLTITSPGGCTSVKTRRVVVMGPTGSFSYQNYSGCRPLTVNFTAATQGRTSFVWDFNDGNTIITTDSVLTHTYTTQGIYIPKMIIKDAAGCLVPIVGADTVVVMGITTAFSADTMLLCSSGTVNFTNNTSSNDMISGYLWSFGDGTTSTSATPTHFYNSEGWYTVKLKAFTALGCRDSITAARDIKIVKTPLVSVTQSADGCVPLNMNFSGNLLNADTSLINWQWNFSDGRSASTKIVNAFLFATAGSYTATMVATNSSGCKDTANTALQVFGLPAVDAGADFYICQGTPKPITPTGAASYTWWPAAGLSCTGCASPLANPANATTYFVTGTSSHGCINSDSVTVAVKYPFKMQYSRGDTLCLGEHTTLTASGAASYSWTPSAGLSSTSAPTVTASPATTTNYMVEGTDAFACFKDTAYFPVKVYPIPTVAAGNDVTLNVGSKITLTPVISADVTKVKWYPADLIYRIVYPSVEVKPKQTTEFRVEASNPGGCTSSDLVTVNVLCNGANVFIPNTFSPNGDGANEIFFPRGTGLFNIKTARIFNRWGEMVYERYDMKPNDSNAGWDGTYKGQKLASDVFIYMYEIVCDNSTSMVYKGDVTLVR